MKSRVLKFTLSIYFMLMAVAFFQLRNSPSRGYEISIYTHTPPLVWVVLIGGIAGGVTIITYQAVTCKKDKWWLMGVFLLLLSTFVITSLPAFRNYLTYGYADTMAHYAMTTDVINTGRADPYYDMYPITHILVANIATISNIPVFIVMGYLPALLSVLYMLSIYVLATVVWRERERVLLTAAASATLLGTLSQTQIAPRAIGVFFFPLIIYLYFKHLKSHGRGYLLMLILLSISYALVHPHYVLMLIGFLIVMPLSKSIYDATLYSHGKATCGGIRLRDKMKFQTLFRTFALLTWMPLIPAIAFFTWIPYSHSWGFEIRALTYAQPGQTFSVVGSESLQVRGLDVINYFIMSWGHIMIYGIIFLITGVIILIKTRKGKVRLENAFHLVIWGFLGEIFAFFLLTTLYHARGITSAIVNREAIVPISPIFVGFFLYELIGRTNGRPDKSIRRKMIFFAAMALIVLSTMIGIFGLYSSPLVYRSNDQVTRMDLSGTYWIIFNKKAGWIFNGLAYPHGIVHLTKGWVELFDDRDTVNSQTHILSLNTMDIPSHFGYQSHKTLGEARAQQIAQHGYPVEDALMIITARFKQGINDPVLQEKMVGSTQSGRLDFNSGDLEKLSLDPSVNKLYSNGEFDVFLVKTLP